MLKNEIYFSLTLLLCYFKSEDKCFSGSLLHYASLPHLFLHRVGIVHPPSLLGRAPSRGSHGLYHRTADRVSLCLSLPSCSGFPSMVFPCCMAPPSPIPSAPPSHLQAPAPGALPVLCSPNLSLTACKQASTVASWKPPEVNFTVMLWKPFTGDPRPAGMHLSLSRSYEDHEMYKIKLRLTY